MKLINCHVETFFEGTVGNKSDNALKNDNMEMCSNNTPCFCFPGQGRATLKPDSGPDATVSLDTTYVHSKYRFHFIK